MSSETGIETTQEYNTARKAERRAEAGTGLLLLFAAVYALAGIVLLLDMLLWRPN